MPGFDFGTVFSLPRWVKQRPLPFALGAFQIGRSRDGAEQFMQVHRGPAATMNLLPGFRGQRPVGASGSQCRAEQMGQTT